MVKNNISDLNMVLFEQLERISDDELTTDQLDKEIKRGKAMNEIARNIIDIANTSINAQKILCDYGMDFDANSLKKIAIK